MQIVQLKTHADETDVLAGRATLQAMHGNCCPSMFLKWWAFPDFASGLTNRPYSALSRDKEQV